MPSITITTVTPSASSEGRYSIDVDYTYDTLTDTGLQYKIDSGSWVDFTAGASPDTLTITGLQSDGVAHTVYIQHVGDAVSDNSAYASPANDVSPGIKIYFDADSTSATDGKIVVRITNAELVAMNYFIGVENTAGVIKAVDTSSADITSVPVTASAYFTVGDIDTSKGGAYLADNYTFDIRSQFGASTPVTMPVETYAFEPLLPPSGSTSILDIDTKVNCTDGTITVTDNTDYTGYTVASRSMSILYPQIPGVSTPVDVPILGSKTATAAITYLNVTYSGVINNLIQKTWTDDNAVEFDYSERFERRVEIYVDCQTDLCSVAACINDEFARLDSVACKAGGYDKMNSTDKNKFMDLTAQLSLFAAAKACNDVEKLETIIKAIRSKLPGDCGCDDSSNNAPVAFTTNPYLDIFTGSNEGGGARIFLDLVNTVFSFRTITSGTPNDITVAESGNNVVISNVQPIVFSIVEYDANAAVADGNGEIYIPIPAVWNGRTVKGMICKGDSGAGTCDVKVLQNGSEATSAVITGVDNAGATVTFTTPITLATNDVLKLKIENTSGTLNGLSCTFWI